MRPDGYAEVCTAAVWMALLLAGAMALLAACQGVLGGVNVVREAGLATTKAVEISKQAATPWGKEGAGN